MTRPGDSIGLYRIDQALGQGAMAAAYAATHMGTGQAVCLKVVHPRLASDPEVRARLDREAALAQQIDHPGVARILGVEEADGHLFLVMELLEGEPMSELLAREQLSVPRAVALVRQACQAAAAAHAAGVVHRDLKPANMVVSPDGHLHVVDFGVARRSGMGGLTEPGKVVGSVTYLAPELWEGAEASVASDIWSLGVTLYRALTGRLPFPGEDLVSISDAVRMKTAPPPSSLRPDLDPRFDDLMASVLAKIPEQRPDSALTLDGLLSPWTPNLRSPGSAALNPAFLAVAAGAGEQAEPSNPWAASANRTMLVRRDSQAEMPAVSPLDEPTLDISRAPEPAAPVSMPAPAGGRSQLVMLLVAGLVIAVLLVAIVAMLLPGAGSEEVAGTSGAARIGEGQQPTIAAEGDATATPPPASAGERTAEAGGAPTEDDAAAGATHDEATSGEEDGVTVDAAADPTSDTGAKPVEHEAQEAEAPQREAPEDEAQEDEAQEDEAQEDEAQEDEAAAPSAPAPAVVADDAASDAEADPPATTRQTAKAAKTRNKVSSRRRERKTGRRASAKTSSKADRDAYTTARKEMDSVMTARGLIAGDVPAVDKARRMMKSALRKRRWRQAREAAERGLSAAKGAEVDRAFINRKLKRFNKRYDAVEDPETKQTLTKLSLDIAKAVGKDRYPEANQLLNRGFKLTRSK